VFDIDWTQNGAEGCTTNFSWGPSDVEPLDTNGAAAGVWNISADWITNAIGGTPNGLLIIDDFKASVNLPDSGLTCFIEGDHDADGVLNEGDRALDLDAYNPGNNGGIVDVNEALVESAPHISDCSDTVEFDADYVVKGDTDNDGDTRLNDILWIRENDA
jgi:hypothetical protein